MDEDELVYIHTIEYYSAIKKNGILPFAATWMNLESVMRSEMSQRKTNTVQYFYVESKKYNKLVNKTKKKQAHRYKEQTSSYQWGWWEGSNIGVGGEGVIMGLYEIMCVKVLKTVKHYRI